MSKYRSADAHPVFALGRAGTRRRLLESLRPEGGLIPLDLELIEIVAELDPGMIDWDLREGKSSYVGLPESAETDRIARHSQVSGPWTGSDRV